MKKLECSQKTFEQNFAPKIIFSNAELHHFKAQEFRNWKFEFFQLFENNIFKRTLKREISGFGVKKP